LFGISIENGVSALYSVSFIKKYELISPSHVSRAIEPLLKEGIVEKIEDNYMIIDIFFKEWIQSKNGVIIT
jgi:uncharacterized protein YkvS